MTEKERLFNALMPSERVPELLPVACDNLARTLLHGDTPVEPDPFNRMAELLLSNALQEWALYQAKRKEEGDPCFEQNVPKAIATA